MQKIDMSTYPRREAYEHFSRVDWPFYSVTFQADVTAAADFARARGLSFYGVMIWAVSRAVNRVDAMLLTIRDGALWKLGRREPSFADLHPGAEQFHIVTLPLLEDPAAFAREAKRVSAAQQVFLDYSKESDGLIFISSLPWLALTGLTNERQIDRDDCTPRLAWGRWQETGGRKLLGLSVEVNHRTVDGLHIARFAQALEEELRSLPL